MKTFKSRMLRWLPIAAAVLFTFATDNLVWSGSFRFQEKNLIPNTILHPIGYTGNETNQVVTITVGIRPGSLYANEMRPALLRALQTWTDLNSTAGNLHFDSDLPSGQVDFESVLLHEIGHVLGLTHPNMVNVYGPGSPRSDFAYSGSGLDSSFATVIGVNDGADGVAGSNDDERADDDGFVWFRRLNNNPFTLDQSEVDQDTYSMSLADLPTVPANETYLNDPVAGNISTDNRSTRGIAAGDVNGDNRPDVVTADILQGVRLYLNNGTAAPFDNSTVGVNIVSGIDDFQAVALGDIDNDNDLDIVVGRAGDPILLFTNDGSGIFGSGIDITSDTNATLAIALGDMNGDNFLDVVAGNSGTPKRLYTNDGSGGFNAGIDITSDANDTRAIAIGDVNEDGFLDIVAGNFIERNRLYLNNGTGGFLGGTDIGLEADRTRAIAIADLVRDSDGPDVVAGNDGVNRFYENGGGTDPFADVTAVNVTSDTDDTAGIAIGDVNLDENLDIVFANIDNIPNKLVLNPGDGSFASAVSQEITSDFENHRAAVLADLDADSDVDLVSGNDGNRNRFYLNRGGRNLFPAVASALVGLPLGFPSTTAVMISPFPSGAAIRTLMADDVATILLAHSGFDRNQGTPDDYSVQLVFAGIDASADVLVDVDDSLFPPVDPEFAFVPVYTGTEIPAANAFLMSAVDIHFNSGTIPDEEFTWYFGATNPLGSPIFVDFAYSGPEDGSQSNPYNTLAEGLAFVADAGTVTIASGSSPATPTINQAVTIEASGGPATIGQGGGASRSVARTGFISRSPR
jgi:hypothetical protein